jgi:hypothetical protein
MKSNIASLMAVAFGLSATSGNSGFSLDTGRTISPAQQRRIDAWNADAPRRNALAAEISVWNGQVKRRNRAFATTGKNKHQRAAALLRS